MAKKRRRREAELPDDQSWIDLCRDLAPYLRRCQSLDPEEVTRIIVAMLAGAEKKEWVSKDAIGKALLWAENGRSTVAFLEAIAALGPNSVRLKWDSNEESLLAQLTDKGEVDAWEIIGQVVRPPKRSRPDEN